MGACVLRRVDGWETGIKVDEIDGLDSLPLISRSVRGGFDFRSGSSPLQADRDLFQFDGTLWAQYCLGFSR